MANLLLDFVLELVLLFLLLSPGQICDGENVEDEHADDYHDNVDGHVACWRDEVFLSPESLSQVVTLSADFRLLLDGVGLADGAEDGLPLELICVYLVVDDQGRCEGDSML